jgi:hypothetical protein
MTIDIGAAERFVLTHARLLERCRLGVLLHGAGPAATLAALAAYQNDDGGFGWALEPDLRGPHSETTSTLDALELLAELHVLDSAPARQALSWVATVVGADGGVPFVLPASLAFPRAPWMQPSEGGSHLTFGFAAVARRARCSEPWVGAAEQWCWERLSDPSGIDGYLLKYALLFLDAHGSDDATVTTLARLRDLVGPDGSVPVPGGTEDEKLTPLALSPHPGAPSRSLFSEQQIGADLDRLAGGQLSDGGWTVDFLQWCPAQGLDWRGLVTVQALSTLREHGRI